MAAAQESTLYPKITNHINEIVKSLRRLNRESEDSEKEVILGPIPIVGTVKLHGTHADILINHDDTILLQSRNKMNLQSTADNQGFAAAMEKKQSTILRLRTQYLSRWNELHPDGYLDTHFPITIAGEWIGEKIQKGVAIAQLSKRFVIISAKIDGYWVADKDYADIEAPEDAFYNISRGGIYNSTLYPEDIQKTINELEPLTERVAARCPFAESFGVIGEGEGLVWKLAPAPYVSNAELWFKTKGGKFKPTFTPAPKRLPVDLAQKREVAATVAAAWCSEQRLEQGWDYLCETAIERNMKGIGPFLKWVQQDIFIEEQCYIDDNKVDKGMLNIEIAAIAKPWFLEKYTKDT